jgi:hypothetical protein
VGGELAVSIIRLILVLLAVFLILTVIRMFLSSRGR